MKKLLFMVILAFTASTAFSQSISPTKLASPFDGAWEINGTNGTTLRIEITSLSTEKLKDSGTFELLVDSESINAGLYSIYYLSGYDIWIIDLKYDTGDSDRFIISSFETDGEDGVMVWTLADGSNMSWLKVK